MPQLFRNLGLRYGSQYIVFLRVSVGIKYPISADANVQRIESWKRESRTEVAKVEVPQ